MPTLAAAILTGYILIGTGLSVAGPFARDLRKTFRETRAELTYSEVPAKWARFSALVFVLILILILVWPVFLWDSRSELASRRVLGGRLFRDTDLSRYPGVHWVGDFVDLRDHLLAVWDPSYCPPLYSRKLGDWTIGLSPAFRKAIGSVDKKLQGRILEAIAGICEDPLTAQGDTKKPLEGNLKGLWRYRIGEFRLIYRPENAASVVVLVDFVARSAGYSGVGD